MEVVPINKRKTAVSFLLFFCFFFCIGCSSVKEVNPAKIQIHMEGSLPYQIDTVLFRNGKAVILETTDSSLISYPHKVFMRQDTLAVYDHSLSSVFFFNKEGKFLHTIHRIGQGPGEYSKLYDVCLDEKNNCLAFLIPNQKILYYSFSGVYLGELSLPNEIISAMRIRIQDDWVYLIPSDGYNEKEIGHSLTIFNRETKEVKDIIRDKLFQDCYTIGSQFSYGDRLLFAQRFNNVVYELKGDEFYPEYQFVLGDFNLPQEQQYKDKYTVNEFLDFCRKNEYVFSITGLVESKKGMLFSSNRPGFFYYDKQSQHIDHYEHILYEPYSIFYYSWLSLEGEPEKVVFVMRGESVARIKDLLKEHPHDSEEYRRKLAFFDQTIDDEPNPILFIYDLK